MSLAVANENTVVIEDAHPDSCAADCVTAQHLLQKCLAVRHHHYQLVLTCPTPAASTDSQDRRWLIGKAANSYLLSVCVN